MVHYEMAPAGTDVKYNAVRLRVKGYVRAGTGAGILRQRHKRYGLGCDAFFPSGKPQFFRGFTLYADPARFQPSQGG